MVAAAEGTAESRKLVAEGRGPPSAAGERGRKSFAAQADAGEGALETGQPVRGQRGGQRGLRDGGDPPGRRGLLDGAEDRGRRDGRRDPEAGDAQGPW